MIDITKLKTEEKIRLVSQRYNQIESSLDERSRRLFAATEAQSLGYGGNVIVSRAIGISVDTIARGRRELTEIDEGKSDMLAPGRVRKNGGGRKRKSEEPGLLKTLREIVESSTVGDPESALLWTARSQRNLIEELAKHGFKVSTGLIGKLLK